jgi:hypothetical protein
MAICTVIKLKTVDQRLTVVQQPILASGDVGTVRVEYELDSYWDDYVSSGTFYTGKTPEDVYEQPLENGACVVPWEALQEDGVLYIGLRGIDTTGLVKTAAPIRYRVERGSPCGSATGRGPTPDVYQRLLALAEETARIAQSIRDDADNGEFDGAPGKKGDKGDPGAKGDPGESGVVAPVSGFFTLAVDAAGNLWAYSEDGNAPALEYDTVTGDLYFVHEQEG